MLVLPLVDKQKHYDCDDGEERWQRRTPEAIVQREKAAWMYAIDVLDQSGFDEWSDFQKVAVSIIGTCYQVLYNSKVDSYLFGLELFSEIVKIQFRNSSKSEQVS